jgi:MOSC domain-containing protein YiiM
MTSSPRVAGLALSPRHRFSKEPVPEVRLLAGHGIEGDAHAGTTVRHRSRRRFRPQDPNLRQVHLLAGELLDELTAKGYDVAPGRLGENVTTVGVDLLALPTGTVLRLGEAAEVEVTGLRNPCVQIDRYSDGLMAQVIGRSDDGEVVRRAGIMGVVLTSGTVRVDDPLTVVLPPGPHQPLRPV